MESHDDRTGHVMARREQGRELFSPAELVILAGAGAVTGVVALTVGWIHI